MKLSEMTQAISEAKAVLDRADIVASDMARLLVGRLRKVDSGYVLGQLKKELSRFNSHTCRWKENA